jgi:acetyltransferase-like isoleucine patch superfamily enzyme
MLARLTDLSWVRVNIALSSFALRSCDRVGGNPSLIGAPHIQNGGRIEIGDDFGFVSVPVQSHLVVHRGATLQIADRVSFGFGCGIACHSQIEIGAGSQIGPFTLILDSDYHVPGDPTARPKPLPIKIGRDVRIGSHVTILRGSQIGDGAIIEPGSVVSGEIMAGERVSGIPARPAGMAAMGESGSIEARIAHTAQLSFRLNTLPGMHHGPNQIARWDSLGGLSFLLALEQEFEITLTQDETAGVRQLVDLVPIVVRSIRRRKQQERAQMQTRRLRASGIYERIATPLASVDRLDEVG